MRALRRAFAGLREQLLLSVATASAVAVVLTLTGAFALAVGNLSGVLDRWGKDVQIDVVGMRSDGRTDVGEVKWGEVSPAAVAAELDTRVRRFPNPDNHTIGRLVFAREGIEAARATELGVQWYGLEDIYGVE